MNTFRRSLRAVGHPASLAAVGLLLVNDHVLKAAMPSWVTGKLSDFAGLFFFPFLLIAIGAWPAAALGEERAGRWVPRLAFAGTAVWFAAIKLWPAANEAMAELLGWLRRARVAIALDAMDVMALVVLVPAWGLWQRAGELQPQRATARLDWKGLAALAVAGAASLATSCSPGQRLVRVAAADGEVYAVLEWAYGGDYQIGQLVSRSWDTGFGLEDALLPEAVAARFGEVITYPRVACDPAEPLTCYRIWYADQLEGSTDGGETWVVVWQVPPARRTYALHYASQLSICGIGWKSDGGPYDLAFVEQTEGSTLIVAMGGRGLLRHTASGQWEELSVGVTGPVPYTGASIWIIWQEVVAAVGAGLAVLIGLTTLAWSRIQRGGAERNSAVRSQNWLPAAGLALVAAYVICWSTTGPFVPILLVVIPVAILIGLIAGWRSTSKNAMRPEQAGKSGLICWLTASGVILLPIAVFYPWMTGIIPWYEVAVALAVMSAAAITVIGGRAALRAARLANEFT